MTTSSTNIIEVSASQSKKEVTINDGFRALSPAGIYGLKYQPIGLTIALYGGITRIGTTPTVVADWSDDVDDDSTIYVRKLISTGAISWINAGDTPAGHPGWPADNGGYEALWDFTTAGGVVVGQNDWRAGRGASGSTGATGATGASWVASYNNQTGTSYTLQASDNGVTVCCNNASPFTLTYPSGLTAPFVCEIQQDGAGQVTVAASGTTINSFNSYVKIAGQHAAARLSSRVTNTANLTGNLSA